MIFAQITPPTEIAAWLACLAFVVMLVNGGFKLTDRITGRKQEIAPQPFAVTGTPLGNAEIQRDLKSMNHRLKSLEDWRSDLTAKMDENKTEILAAGEERAVRIYDHVDNVRRELDAKIDAIPERVIATLKNTGAI